MNQSRLFASPSLAVAVPTKNRPDDLAVTIDGVLRQTRLAQQVIVVDQSSGSESQLRVDALMNALPAEVRSSIQLVYIRDASLSGLTAARNRALLEVTADIVLFLDDDVILEDDFNEKILEVFHQHPAATGVSGIVTNYSAPPAFSRHWSRIFMTAPFWDDRQPVYWNADKLRGGPPVRVTRLGGGLMAFRMAAIAGIPFDENLRGACPGEDVEFCARLQPGAQLFITPAARLIHNMSPAGRKAEHWLAKHAWTMAYLYHRNWSGRPRNQAAFLWLKCGYALAAALSSLRRLSWAPWRDWAKATRQARALVDSNRQAALEARCSPGGLADGSASKS